MRFLIEVFAYVLFASSIFVYSFGVLPLESPSPNDSLSFMSPVPSTNMLSEANDQKVLVKRASRPRTHVGVCHLLIDTLKVTLSD